MKSEKTDDVSVKAVQLGFYVAVMGFIRFMKVAEIIDTVIDSNQENHQKENIIESSSEELNSTPSVGQCIEAMILNIFTGKVALYNMSLFLQNLPMEMFWGSHIDASKFTDDRLALALDKLYNAGLNLMYSKLLESWCGRFNLTINKLFMDTTTIPLSGDYDVEEEENVPNPARGYSKDNDRINKQFVLSLMSQADGVPVSSGLHSGNEADSTVFKKCTIEASSIVKKIKDEFFIADSKLCDKLTLGLLRKDGIHPVTLLPKTFKLHDELIKEAFIKTENFKKREINDQNKDDENINNYELYKTTMDMDLVDPETNDTYKEIWSVVVVKSYKLIKSKEKKIKANKEKEKINAEKISLDFSRHIFYKKEDAENSLLNLNSEIGKNSPYRLEGKCIEAIVPVKRKVGRPKNGERPDTQTEYKLDVSIIEKQEHVPSNAEAEGCFILITSKRVSEKEGWDMVDKYKEKNVSEENFHWIKTPAKITPIFLHKPTRIAALAFIFVIALAVYRIMQREIRRNLKEQNEAIFGHHGKQTQKPTIQFIAKIFAPIIRIEIDIGGKISYILQGWTQQHEDILAFLGLPRDLYTKKILIV